MGFRALEAAENAIWAMEESALSTLLTIAAREHEITPEALEAYEAKSLARAEQATVRDGVAIIAANGPLFKRANLMTAFSGATSYDIIRRDLQAAVDDPQVKAAILLTDSPGGEAGVVAELAGYIASLRGTFPVVAYVSDMGASAAYWLASAAQEIVVAPTAILGSIGVQMALRSRDDPKGVTTHTFISSQSPMKNADPASAEGAAHIQGVVDAMAQVFVDSVAANRGVSVQTVLSGFGKGGIFVGQDAVKAGLADRVGNFEGVLAELSAGRTGPIEPKGKTVAQTKLDPRLAAIVEAAVAASNAQLAMSAATPSPAVPVIDPAILAARAAEAKKMESDERIASIAGVSVADITAKRHAQEAEDTRHKAETDAQAAKMASEQSAREALIARIAAA